MKKFLIQIISFALLVFAVLGICCIAIDPFNVFHPYSIRNNGVEPAKNYIKMKYLLSNADKYDSLLFGSSRVGNIHADKLNNVTCYNMTSSGAIPKLHLENIKTLISNGFVPKNIYIGLDENSYSETLDSLADSEFSAPYEYSINSKIKFWSKYLNPSTVGSAVLSTIIPHQISEDTNPDFVSNFYKYGWNYDYGYTTLFSYSSMNSDDSKAFKDAVSSTLTLQGIKEASSAFYMDDTLNDIKEIISVCKENNINLVFFTNPLFYQHNYDVALCRDYYTFLYKLSQITDYYNFSGFNGLTDTSVYFIDYSHSNAELGDYIVEVLNGGKLEDNLSNQCFGEYVTKDNADEFILKLLA